MTYIVTVMAVMPIPSLTGNGSDSNERDSDSNDRDSDNNDSDAYTITGR